MGVRSTRVPRPRRARSLVASATRAAALSASLLVPLSGCGDGDAPEQGATSAEPSAPPPGFWFAVHERPDVDLGHLGYAAGTRAASAAVPSGVEVVDPGASAPGWNLYCSGHAPEARLLAPDGRVAHTWAVDYATLRGVPPLKHPTQRAWRRVRLADDGGLFALHEALVLLRLDADSRLLWSVALGAHHDFDLDEEGRVHVLTRRAVEHPELAHGRLLVDDRVAIVSPAGAVLREVSLLEALAASPWAHLLDEAARVAGGREIDPGDGLARDLMHVNSYALLGPIPPGLPAAFQPGRALVCLRELDAVAVVDLDQERFVWLLQGGFDGPHDPELAPDGRLWLFDNGLHRGWSRALALDPNTGREVRQWPPRPDPSFHSEVCGALQLLPGGNLLLTESTAGRALEVTPADAVVWTFGTPHRVTSATGPLVACLFEVERLPVESIPMALR